MTLTNVPRAGTATQLHLPAPPALCFLENRHRWNCRFPLHSNPCPGYYVIDWLPIYNFVMGALTVLVVAPLIWRGSRWALPAAPATFAAHSLVMVVLRTAYSDVVAPDSLRAMTIRMVAWLLILALMFVQARRSRPTPA